MMHLSIQEAAALETHVDHYILAEVPGAEFLASIGPTPARSDSEVMDLATALDNLNIPGTRIIATPIIAAKERRIYALPINNMFALDSHPIGCVAELLNQLCSLARANAERDSGAEPLEKAVPMKFHRILLHALAHCKSAGIRLHLQLGPERREIDLPLLAWLATPPVETRKNRDGAKVTGWRNDGDGGLWIRLGRSMWVGAPGLESHITHIIGEEHRFVGHIISRGAVHMVDVNSPCQIIPASQFSDREQLEFLL